MTISKYEILKLEWILKNPHSTPMKYQIAMCEIARKCGI
jgi:hypothetical protein